MYHVSVPARRKARAGLFSKAAMAIALASGSLIASAGIATPAYAQDYSKEWRQAAAPVSDTVKKTDEDEQVKALIARAAAADGAEKQALIAQVDAALDGVLAKLKALEPVASTPDDKYSTGQFNLNLGNKLHDGSLQMQGLKLMVDSGKTPADQLPLFNYYVGSLAWEARDYATARQYLNTAFELGHQAENLERLIAETYFEQGQFAEGLAALDQMIAKRGATIPEDTYRRALQIAYEEDLKDQVVKRSADLVRYHPSEDTWNTALRVVLDSFDFTSDESLDLFRLMKLTNAIREARTYVDYIEAADARRMANEVLPLIDEAIAAGLLNPDDVFVKDARDVAVARAEEDREAAEEDAAAARASTDAISARAAADNYLALQNYAEAEELYKLALERAPEDADRLNMRIGLVQAYQGKLDDARASLGKVTGKRANVAAMWLTYLDTQQGG